MLLSQHFEDQIDLSRYEINIGIVKLVHTDNFVKPLVYKKYFFVVIIKL